MLLPEPLGTIPNTLSFAVSHVFLLLFFSHSHSWQRERRTKKNSSATCFFHSFLPALLFHLICSLLFALLLPFRICPCLCLGECFNWGKWGLIKRSHIRGSWSVFKPVTEPAGSVVLNGKIDKMIHRGRRVWKSREWKCNQKKEKKEINSGAIATSLVGLECITQTGRGEDRANRCWGKKAKQSHRKSFLWEKENHLVIRGWKGRNKGY